MITLFKELLIRRKTDKSASTKVYDDNSINRILWENMFDKETSSKVTKV